MLGKLGGDASKLLPYRSGSGVVGDAHFNADSAPPEAVWATLEGSTLSWTKSASTDVVGYRVYRLSDGGKSLVSSMKSYEGAQISVSPGVRYIVVAVDITGQESSYSNEVGQTIEPKPVDRNRH